MLPKLLSKFLQKILQKLLHNFNRKILIWTLKKIFQWISKKKPFYCSLYRIEFEFYCNCNCTQISTEYLSPNSFFYIPVIYLGTYPKMASKISSELFFYESFIRSSGIFFAYVSWNWLKKNFSHGFVPNFFSEFFTTFRTFFENIPANSFENLLDFSW